MDLIKCSKCGDLVYPSDVIYVMRKDNPEKIDHFFCTFCDKEQRRLAIANAPI